MASKQDQKQSSGKRSPAKPDQQCDVNGKQTFANQDVEEGGERQYFKRYVPRHNQDDEPQELRRASWKQKQGNSSKRSYYQKLTSENHNRDLNRNWRSDPRQQEVKDGNPSPKLDRNFNDKQRQYRSCDNLSSGHHDEQDRGNVNQRLQQSYKQRQQSCKQRRYRSCDNLSSGHHHSEQELNRGGNINQQWWRSSNQQHYQSSDNLSSRNHHNEQEFNRGENVNQRLQQNCKQRYYRSCDDLSSRHHRNKQEFNGGGNDNQRWRRSFNQHQSLGNDHLSNRNQGGHGGNGPRNNGNDNQRPGRKDHRRKNCNRSFSGPITPDNLPSWKLFLLRSSYHQGQIVEFRRHQGSYYSYDENIDKLLYRPHLLYPIESNQQEIADIARIFQEWINKIQTKCTDPSIFNGVYVKIRCGCSYITLLDPYIDQMPVSKFKAHFNRFLSKTGQSSKIKCSHRISNSFYPIISSGPIDINDHANSVLDFDSQKESILMHVKSRNHKTQTAINYNAEMELLEYRKDIILFKLDVQNTSQGNDVETTSDGRDARIALYSDICRGRQEIPFNCQLIAKSASPPIRRDSHKGFVVRPNYRRTVISIRHKDVKFYKLKSNSGLWDPFRQAAVVNVADVTEYRFVDRATGQFKDVHRKHEIHVKVPLYQLLTLENCHNIAQSIHSLAFTILPECIS